MFFKIKTFKRIKRNDIYFFLYSFSNDPLRIIHCHVISLAYFFFYCVILTSTQKHTWHAGWSKWMCKGEPNFTRNYKHELSNSLLRQWLVSTFKHKWSVHKSKFYLYEMRLMHWCKMILWRISIWFNWFKLTMKLKLVIGFLVWIE